jgi:hypothetical protein
MIGKLRRRAAAGRVNQGKREPSEFIRDRRAIGHGVVTGHGLVPHFRSSPSQLKARGKCTGSDLYPAFTCMGPPVLAVTTYKVPEIRPVGRRIHANTFLKAIIAIVYPDYVISPK